VDRALQALARGTITAWSLAGGIALRAKLPPPRREIDACFLRLDLVGDVMAFLPFLHAYHERMPTAVLVA
jgi:hypothetical protein